MRSTRQQVRVAISLVQYAITHQFFHQVVVSDTPFFIFWREARLSRMLAPVKQRPAEFRVATRLIAVAIAGRASLTRLRCLT